jgi:hypothetical protein
MTQAIEKMDKQARITLGRDVNIGATVDAVLTKNRYVANLAAIPDETAKRTDDALFDSALKGYRLPDIDRINRSLQKGNASTEVHIDPETMSSKMSRT